jgi:hypothetical protein
MTSHLDPVPFVIGSAYLIAALPKVIRLSVGGVCLLAKLAAKRLAPLGPVHVDFLFLALVNLLVAWMLPR